VGSAFGRNQVLVLLGMDDTWAASIRHRSMSKVAVVQAYEQIKCTFWGKLRRKVTLAQEH
jgi:hypothetical protein